MMTDVDHDMPAEAVQCLRLEQMLFAARQERDLLLAQLKVMAAELAEARHHLNPIADENLTE